MMRIETVTSRKNQYIVRLRSLCAEGSFRRSEREYVCDGMKLLEEAIHNGAEILSVLWKDKAEEISGLEAARQYVAPAELFDYASPMKNSPGPIFTLRMPENGGDAPIKRAIALENVQDPGNVGTVIRTAAAFGIDAVILCGACADVYSPKAARATMGAIFRERIIYADTPTLRAMADKFSLPLYGAALTDTARDIRSVDVKNSIVAIGSEGHGLSAEILAACDGEIIIPMAPDSESLNAAVAASVSMWEMAR